MHCSDNKNISIYLFDLKHHLCTHLFTTFCLCIIISLSPQFLLQICQYLTGAYSKYDRQPIRKPLVYFQYFLSFLLLLFPIELSEKNIIHVLQQKIHNKYEGFLVSPMLAHCCAIFLGHLAIEIQIDDRQIQISKGDHLVGQSTTPMFDVPN